MTDIYQKFLDEFTYDCTKHELGDPTEWAEQKLQTMTHDALKEKAEADAKDDADGVF